MPTGERAVRRQRRCAERGFTYVLLLFSVALMGAGLAALGTSWQLAGQREREAELLFRGLQIRDALQRFNAATPTGTRPLPLALDELLIDRRGLEPRYHLRRLYADPFSGLADWALLREAGGGIVGVHSRSQRPALRQHDLPVFVQAAVPAASGATAGGPAPPVITPAGRDDRNPSAEPAAAPPRLSDWQFRIQPQLTVTRKRP